MIGSLKRLQNHLLSWYTAHRRDLPWRPAPNADSAAVDPYHVLVSEAMLQQTQVATVVPYFLRFIDRYATIETLAEAPPQEVLRLWQGLGYYARARNLHAAARMLVAQYDGVVPRSVPELLKLPGVGRYTAGAIASIAFDVRAPILDGNVMRVLCRIDGIEADPRQRPTQQRLWARAEEILPDEQAGNFNSALMELGATVCTPRQPDCPRCPLRAHCQARLDDTQNRIPLPRPTRQTPQRHRQVFVIEQDGSFLLEQRPPTGRWAGMWQFITRPAEDAEPSADAATRLTGVRIGWIESVGQIRHALTHRRYRFDVYRCRAAGAGGRRAAGIGPPTPHRQWLTLEQIEQIPLPRPQQKICDLAGRETSG